MRHPSSTYRLQIRPSFDLAAAADVVGYLRELGADWVYTSPLLQAAVGSAHGYDVVDPARPDDERGGADGIARLAEACRAAGLGILVDIVPNHMGVGSPDQNDWWWDLLTHGRTSRFAEAFDVDWDAAGGRIRLPLLDGSLDSAIDSVSVDAAAGVVRYRDSALPLAPGSLDGIDVTDIPAVLARQHWELIGPDQDAEHNYRRFFTVSWLAAVRVEVPWVFDAAHEEVGRWFREGLVDGLRIDHPDGLADPGEYLQRLDRLTGGAYVVVEKILEHAATEHPERLPAWWHTEGTTGYDAMAEIDRVLIDPAGEGRLDRLDAELRAEAGLAPALAWLELIHGTKRTVAETSQAAEVARLVRATPDEARAGAADERVADAFAELLACFSVYRSYLPAGREHLEQAAAEASARRPELAETISALVTVLADPGHEVARRFQQTTGPVMAKGVEDAGFYRQTRLGTLTEVGGDPSVFSLPVDGLHRAFAERQAAWPLAMTALSTHDTKRSEDVRARLSVLAELQDDELRAMLGGCIHHASTGHPPLDLLIFQAAIGAWPLSRERLQAYALKGAREGGERTSWHSPDAAFEQRVTHVVDAVFDEPALRAHVEAAAARLAPYGWSNSLSAKLLQLAGPGVPDVYQGAELWDLSLVDPDNRRPVDFGHRRRLLAELDERLAKGDPPSVDETGSVKMLVTSRALRLRRDRSDLFTRYTPMTVVGDAADHAIAFDRGGAVVVATRLPIGLERRGGWGDEVLLRHAGPTFDAFTGRRYESDRVSLAELLSTYPVALLVASAGDEGGTG